jgi:DNA-binding Lrp family transcriptional regulator
MPHDHDKDIPFLAALQDNGRITIKDLANKTKLTLGACTKRIKRMLSEGSIAKFTVVINYRKFGYNNVAYTMLSCNSQNSETVNRLTENLKKIENVTEIHKMLGDYDLLIKIRTRDTTELQYILENIGDTGLIREVKTMIMSETIRDDVGLPAHLLYQVSE